MEYPYIYRGKVLNNSDPKNLGRCKVLVPSIYGNNMAENYLPWSRPIAATNINEGAGSYCIPEVGDIVWVFYEGGDPDSPVHIGGTYGINDIPIDIDKVVLYEYKGDKIYYNKSTRLFDISIGSSRIEVSESDGVLIKSATKVVLSTSEVTLDSNVTVTGNVHVMGNIVLDGDVHYTSAVFPD